MSTRSKRITRYLRDPAIYDVYNERAQSVENLLRVYERLELR